MWSVCDLLRLLSIFVLSSYYGRSQTHGSGLDSCGDSFSCSVANDTLNFLFMSSSDAQFNNSGSFVAAKIAVEQVNAAQDVLQGYSLEISSRRDSECDSVVSLREFITEVTGLEPRILAVIGTGCSEGSERISEISYFWDLPVISYASSVSLEVSRDSLPFYYQLLPTEANYIPAVASIISCYGWMQFTIISEDEHVFLDNAVHLEEALEMSNITVLESPLIDSGDNVELPENLFNGSSARIFFVNTYEDKARQIVCKGYEMNFVYPNYGWIFLGAYSEDWWRADLGSDISCTSEQMLTVVNRSLVVQQFPVIEDINEKAIGNLSYNDFYEIYSERIEDSPYRATPLAHVTYDAVWTLALALNQTKEAINSGDDSCNISGLPAPPASRFDYLDINFSCLLQQSLKYTNFLGLSGVVHFSSVDQSRDHQTVRIFQHREEQLVQIAQFGESTGLTFQYISGENNETVYPEGIPPDGTPIKIISAHHTATVVLLYTLASLGMILAAVCLVFNIVYRNHKAFLLTSPVMNYFIIVGSVFIYVSVFVRVIPTNSEDVWRWMCGLAFWLGGFGYTLSFGPILAKMWRVFQVFHNQFTTSSLVPNPGTKHMLILVITINLLQMFLLTVGFIPNASRPQPVAAVDSERPSGSVNEQGIEVQYCVYNCFTSDSFPWLITCFLYLALLQFIAVVLAIQTRNVKIRILNDSKEVAIIIYLTSFVMIVMLASTFILSDYNNVSDGIFGSSLMISTSVTLIVVFLPKMWWLHKDKSGENVILERGKSFTSIQVERGGALKVRSEATIATLKKRIEVLEMRIEEKEHLAKMGISEHSSHGSRSFTDAFREVSRKISRRSLRSEVAESELRNTCGGATCDNDVFVTEHADKEDVKTEEEATGDSKV